MNQITTFLGTIDVARTVTAVLVVFQGCLALWLFQRTSRKLMRATTGVATAVERARNCDTPGVAAKGTGIDIEGAYNAVYFPRADDEVLEPVEAFSAERLLPRDYNSRMDAAAPGLFTGLGIAGTFGGLLIAFSKINPADAEHSIQPLLAGMHTAFWNSLVGVVLALGWTLSSRMIRHAFDKACRDLARVAERRFGRPTAGSQVLQRFSALQATLTDKLGELNTQVAALGGATANSSKELLDKLAPSLEQSFKSLVDMPFDRLNTTVAAYEASVERVNQQHAETVSALNTSVSLLTEAKVGLAETLTTATACVQQFEGAVATMRSNVDAATEVVDASRRAADTLGKTATTIQVIGERHGQLASALGGAVTELRTTSGTLETASKGFDASADRLEKAALTIENLSSETARESVAAVRVELQEAIRGVAEALTAFGADGAKAYEASTGRVIEAVDEKMSDLTDRLSAELSTLAARLPESMEDLSNATRDVRIQITKAVRTLDEAVKQLDVGTRKSLAGQLTEYDALLAKAMNHFSGTITTWDGKVDQLHQASRELHSALTAGRKLDGQVTPGLPTSAHKEGARA